jgi:SRSO17 transposase
MDEAFQTSKGRVGLDQHQVRRYDAWYRHVTLVLVAQAFLVVTRTTATGERAKGDTAA